MPRPQRSRRICCAPRVDGFSADGSAGAVPIVLTLDEYEVIRLVDLEGKTHGECAAQMDISRSTVQEIYECARKKLAACIVYGRNLKITGGNYRICDGQTDTGCSCSATCAKADVENTSVNKGDLTMKIAVTYENGKIFGHFGHTEQFKIYEVADGAVVSSTVVDTNGSGHGALAGFLMQNGVDTLICGGIGGGAQAALREAGIKLYGGVSGSADDAVAALLQGRLAFNPNVRCSHHDSEHGGEGHICGDHGCGKHSCH